MTEKAESMIDLIYSISPVDSPFFIDFNYGRVKFRIGKGGSMRKQRRRKVKPIKFTAARDSLSASMNGL